MIVWTGRGFLSILILGLSFFLCDKFIPTLHSDYVFIISLYIAGLFSYFFGIKWNNQVIQIFIDKETGKEVAFKKHHSLFWIKMEYWGVIFISLGLVILFQNTNREGIEFYSTLFLGLLFIVSLLFFMIKLIKQNTVVNKR